MIIHLLEKLKSKTIILASGSPRRLTILKDQLGLSNIQVNPSNFDEKSLDKHSYKTVHEFVKDNASKKAQSVYSQLTNSQKKNCIVIGADTVVVLDNQEIKDEETQKMMKRFTLLNGQYILEKPENEKEAFLMLKALSNTFHYVVSGVSIVFNFEEGSEESSNCMFHEDTKVYFDDLCESEIQAYIKTKEPFDKAGGYGIQDRGGAFVTKINGDYFNVMGFPLNHFCKEVNNFMGNLIQEK